MRRLNSVAQGMTAFCHHRGNEDFYDRSGRQSHKGVDLKTFNLLTIVFDVEQASKVGVLYLKKWAICMENLLLI